VNKRHLESRLPSSGCVLKSIGRQYLQEEVSPSASLHILFRRSWLGQQNYVYKMYRSSSVNQSGMGRWKPPGGLARAACIRTHQSANPVSMMNLQTDSLREASSLPIGAGWNRITASVAHQTPTRPVPRNAGSQYCKTRSLASGSVNSGSN
jgi:hypothetical protein